jgi:hypothetical protein
MTKNPKIRHAKVKPDNKYKGLLQVGLQRSQKRKLVIRTCIHPYLVNCVRILLRTVLKAAPIGAPAEKVAKAIERDGPGGNAFDRIPSWRVLALSELANRLPKGDLQRPGSWQQRLSLVSLA